MSSSLKHGTIALSVAELDHKKLVEGLLDSSICQVKLHDSHVYILRLHSFFKKKAVEYC
jgi:hypothetical protein